MAFPKPGCIESIFYLNILILCFQGNTAFPDFPPSGVFSSHDFPVHYYNSFVAVCGKVKLHGQMNSSLLKQKLNAESGKEVQDCENVQLRILSKRSVDDERVIRVRLSAFGEDIHLRLQRKDDERKPARLYEVKLTDNGIQFTQVLPEDDGTGTPYIDPAKMAAVTVLYGPDGKLKMDGVIGDLVIKPASIDMEILGDYYTYDDDFSGESAEGIDYSENLAINLYGHSSVYTLRAHTHIVYRSYMKSKAPIKAAQNDMLNTNCSAANRRRHKRPLHAWVEVLLLVDYDTYAMHMSHGLNDTEMRRYYITFLNGDRDATPYLKNNLYPNLNKFNGDRAIRDLTRHLYLVKTQQQDNYTEFDVAILLTNLDMCNDDIFYCNSGLYGLGYFKGVCTISHVEQRWAGVAIVEDKGGFDGILTAAHEIGHLLGSDHDGERPPIFEFQNTSYCSHEDGYIMSHKLASDRIFQWSKCSIKQFRDFLSSESAFCLFNQPNQHNELEGSELPGALISLDEQCNRIWGTQAFARDFRVCITLHCDKPTDEAMKTRNLQASLPPAAEGSSCGEGLHCRHGKCVSKYLTYSQAWNMAPVQEKPAVSTTKKPPTKRPPFLEEGCTEDKAEFFCDSYFWTISRKEACENSRILEECCYSHKIFCKVKPF